ncbi:membrane protein [Campylobacterota bacterium]|nr:membrane protein [Campylobacterota bacterium]
MDRALNRKVEHIVESIIVSSRYLVLTAVFFSLVGAAALFIIASYDIVESVIVMCKYYFLHDPAVDLHADGVALIIGAIDLYLIAVVLLIFSFGIYELFISKIEALESIDLKDINILTIKSLDQLKDKLAKVILMVLIVSFFQGVLHMKFTLPIEMLYLAISILALGIALYFMNKNGHH